MAKIKKQNQDFGIRPCVMCKYFQNYSDGTNVPYTLDRNCVKHRKVHYMCLYDLHEIVPGHICDRGYPLYGSIIGGLNVSDTEEQ